jgi:hypothetical protein
MDGSAVAVHSLPAGLAEVLAAFASLVRYLLTPSEAMIPGLLCESKPLGLGAAGGQPRRRSRPPHCQLVNERNLDTLAL